MDHDDIQYNEIHVEPQRLRVDLVIPTYSGGQHFTLDIQVDTENEVTRVFWEFPHDALDPDAGMPSDRPGLMQFYLGTPESN